MSGLLFCNVSKTVSIKCKHKRKKSWQNRGSDAYLMIGGFKYHLWHIASLMLQPFLWLELRWSSTARLHRLLVDHLDGEHLTESGWIAELSSSAVPGTACLS